MHSAPHAKSSGQKDMCIFRAARQMSRLVFEMSSSRSCGFFSPTLQCVAVYLILLLGALLYIIIMFVTNVGQLGFDPYHLWTRKTFKKHIFFIVSVKNMFMVIIC